MSDMRMARPGRGWSYSRSTALPTVRKGAAQGAATDLSPRRDLDIHSSKLLLFSFGTGDRGGARVVEA